jgi:ABC-type uncharacterized transport system substrate-binding protein
VTSEADIGEEVTKKVTVFSLGVLLFALCVLSAILLAIWVPAQAQQAQKMARVGVLLNNPAGDEETRQDFLRGLRELGWIEGKTIIIESRWYDGDLARLSKLAAELVRLKVDLILAPTSIAVEAVKRETVTIPIVFAVHGDPVGVGHVASLAHPGGNITGLSQLQGELNAKGLELLKEVVPKMNRIAVLWYPQAPSHKTIIKAIEATGKELRLRLIPIGVDSGAEIETAFATMVREKADAVLVLQAPIFNPIRKQVVDLAIKHRLPSMFGLSYFVEIGGMMSYGANLSVLYRHAAVYADKILKGAKPADLPVEQPKKFEFVINLKTAKQIGLTIPQSVLYRADKVIK